MSSYKIDLRNRVAQNDATLWFTKSKVFTEIQLSRSLIFFQGALLSLRQFLATESPLKIMKNAFYFTPKALFVLTIFKFLSGFFGHV